jgi:hypothetical protein
LWRADYGFFSADHEGITAKPVIVQTTDRMRNGIPIKALCQCPPIQAFHPTRRPPVSVFWSCSRLLGSGAWFGTSRVSNILQAASMLFWRQGRRSMRKMLFHGVDAILVVHHSAAYTPVARLASIPLRWGYGFGGSRRWLNWGESLSREARHERPYHKLDRYAQANGFGLGQPHWRMLANDDEVQAVGKFCAAHNITTDPVNDPDGRDMVVICDGAMDAERQWPPSNFAPLAAAIRAE